MMLELGGHSLAVNLALFAGAAIVVWIAGTRLAEHGDEIAERLDLAREFVGLIFLAAVTDSPRS